MGEMQGRYFIVTRSRWARGGKNGALTLLNDSGNKCCMGFYESQISGRSDADLLSAPLPSDLPGRHSVLSRDFAEPWKYDFAEPWGYSRHHESILAQCNDDESISDSDREAFIADYFATWLGVGVGFVP